MIIEFRPKHLSDTGRFYLDCLRRQDIKEYVKTLPTKAGISRLNTRTATILLRSLRQADSYIAFVQEIPSEIVTNDQITGTEKIDLAGVYLLKQMSVFAPVGIPMTPDQWMTHFAPEYGLTSKVYLLNMCRGMRMRYRTRKGGQPREFVASLPEPFKAERLGNQWIIYV